MKNLEAVRGSTAFFTWKGFDASQEALRSGRETTHIRAIDFLQGRTHTEAIEAAFASAGTAESVAEIVLDTQDWLIDRAILLPSNRTLVIDCCQLKLAEIENVIEETASSREACVKIYTGYGSGYKKGNLRNIAVTNVVSRGALYAVMVKADVEDWRLSNITQLNPQGVRLNLL